MPDGVPPILAALSQTTEPPTNPGRFSTRPIRGLSASLTGHGVCSWPRWRASPSPQPAATKTRRAWPTTSTLRSSLESSSARPRASSWSASASPQTKPLRSCDEPPSISTASCEKSPKTSSRPVNGPTPAGARSLAARPERFARGPVGSRDRGRLRAPGTWSVPTVGRQCSADLVSEPRRVTTTGRPPEPRRRRPAGTCDRAVIRRLSLTPQACGP